MEFLVVFSFVAAQLLDFEARSGEQVPLLLKMKRSHLALSKAVESGDTDLGEPPAPTNTYHVQMKSVLLYYHHHWRNFRK